VSGLLSAPTETFKVKSSEFKGFIEYATECHLRRISIANRCYNGAQPFRALEVIQLYSVSIVEEGSEYSGWHSFT
jgi:hypothetical protein